MMEPFGNAGFFFCIKSQQGLCRTGNDNVRYPIVVLTAHKKSLQTSSGGINLQIKYKNNFQIFYSDRRDLTGLTTAALNDL